MAFARPSLRSCSVALPLVFAAAAAQSPQQHPAPPEPPKPGITLPGIERSMETLKPLAIFHAAGMPDWMAVTPSAVWVTSSRAGLVTELDARSNQPGRTIAANKPCSGLLYAEGSLWIPSCGDHSLLRADPATGAILARIPAGPADSEGGIAAGAGSIWLVTDAGSPSADGTLTRISAETNTVQAAIPIPSGSVNPLFADGALWISSHTHNALLRLDPATNRVTATIPTGQGPRFLTYGAGSVWTLNQGDGTISRIRTATAQRIANIEAGIPGSGGEMCFGFGAAWATVIGFPITRIDAATNQVTAQWKGPGGDSIRMGFGSLWLTDLFHGTIWRFAPPTP